MGQGISITPNLHFNQGYKKLYLKKHTHLNNLFYFYYHVLPEFTVLLKSLIFTLFTQAIIHTLYALKFFCHLPRQDTNFHFLLQ